MNSKVLAVASCVLAGSFVLTAGSCAQPQRGDRAAGTPVPCAVRDREPYLEHHQRPPLIDMQDVMQAKLVHTQAIVEGLAFGNLKQVAANAARLEEASSDSRWMVHDTLTYIVLSEEFRKLARRMTENAQARNMDAVASDYAALTNSCVKCHEYLRKEREQGGLPGRVSMLDWRW